VTGAVRWRSVATTRPAQDGPWLVTVGGRPAAALVGDGLLSYWPLPSSTSSSAAASGARDEAIGVRLPAGATVTWVGGSPLVTSRGGGAGVISPGGYRSVPLPPGGRALAADGATVLAVAGTTFVRQPVGRPAERPRALPRPRGASSRPVRTEAVGTSFLLTVWPRAKGRGQVAALVDTASGALVVQTDLEASVDLTRAGVVRETAGRQTVLGSVLVDTYSSNLNLLDPRYTVRSVTRGHAWATLTGKATDIHLNRAGEFRPVPFPAGDPALPIGVVAAAGRAPETAVVLAPSGGGWILCGLRATSSEAAR
jgi:hypothetical protein